MLSFYGSGTGVPNISPAEVAAPGVMVTVSVAVKATELSALSTVKVTVIGELGLAGGDRAASERGRSLGNGFPGWNR